ncbi:hypothetical protein [Streptomyces sp. NPDC060035]|uniref:hypothetical protein n=1 Tax=Streptomyces sp. NPDC060035 TaxID=3347044 RepID=UPI003687F754
MRREDRRLREDVDILKRTTVFFAKRPVTVHPFIELEKAGHSVIRARERMKVSRPPSMPVTPVCPISVQCGMHS